MDADRLILDLVHINRAMEELQVQKRALVAQLPRGRTEGTELAVYKSGGSVRIVSKKRVKEKK